jgi:hypothetical protein
VNADAAVDAAVAALSDGAGVYVSDRGRAVLGRAAGRPIAEAVLAANSRFFVAVLGEPSSRAARVDLDQLVDGVHRDGTYVVVGDGGFLATSDVTGIDGNIDALLAAATDAHPGDLGAQVVAFVERADAAAAAGPATIDDVATDAQPDDDGGGSGALIPLLVLGGIGGFVVWTLRRRRAVAAHAEAEAFADVRRAADQDVTALGEELTALDVPAASGAAMEDYQAALDCYDNAKVALERARRPQQLSAVTEQLEEGRWRLECVRARTAGRALPERRPPCFFNPQHGPSTTDVSWSPRGGARREVPACAADADRLARGEDPESRLVQSGGELVPYWRGPAYFGPYAGGFFGGWGGGSFLSGLLLGQFLTMPMAYGDSGYDAGYDDGYDAGQNGGGADDGGGDGSGGDWDSGAGGGWSDGGWDSGGGGDWGGDWGGDFGGGDF